MKGLEQFDDALASIIKDIEEKDISFEEVEERAREAYKLIPYDIDVNPVGFDNFVKEKYGKYPNSLTFNIERIFN